MNSKLNKGFSLLEILVALAIVGILAAIAYPAYRNYMLSSTLSQAFALVDEEKIKIELYYVTHNKMPSTGDDAGIIEFPDYELITQLKWSPGIPGKTSDKAHVGTLRPLMDLTSFGSQYGIYNSTFFFVGTADKSGEVSWKCVVDKFDGDALPAEFLPASCR